VIASILTYRLRKRWTVAEATAVFESTAPKYLRMPGLVRKHYCLTEAGDCVLGVYLWKSKADAEACYTADRLCGCSCDGGQPARSYRSRV